MEQHSLNLCLAIVVIYYLQCCFGFSDLLFLAEPQDGVVPVNSSLLLQCEAAGLEPITYYWKHNERHVNQTSRSWSIVNGSLSIWAVDQTTTGIYQCCAHNQAGVLCSRNASVSLTRIGVPQVLPDNTQVQEGASIRLLCQVDAASYGRLKVIWLKGGIPLLLKTPRMMQLPEFGGILHITSAELSDSGLYSCNVSNEFEESQISTEVTVSVATRTVEDPWGILVGPADTDAMVGSDVILECLLTAHEHVDVSWGRTDGRDITLQNSKVYGHHNLLLKNVSLDDQATYKCSAINLVTGEEDMVAALLYILQPPYFQSPVTNEEKSESVTGRLKCKVAGQPLPPFITWYKDGELVPIKGRVSQFDSASGHTHQILDSSLVIWNSMAEDIGIYQCVAASEAGTVWGAMFYNVKVPENRPFPPNNVTAIVNDSHTITVRWKPVPQPDVRGHSIYYYPTPDGSWAAKVAQMNDTEVVLGNLQPYTNYTIQVKTFVRHGGSNLTKPVYAATMETLPDSAPWFWLTSSSPFSINISWLPLPLQDSNGPVHMYKICYKEDASADRSYSCFEKSAGINSMVLNNLQAATRYKVKMAAATTPGFGPDSKWLGIRTMDARNCTLDTTLQIVREVINVTAVEIKWSVIASKESSESETSNIDGFKMTITSYNDMSQQMRKFDKDTRKVVIGGLEREAAYNLVMQAWNECGEGHVTSIAFQMPRINPIRDKPILLPPYDLRAQAVSSRVIHVQWEPPQTYFTVTYYSVLAEPPRNSYAKTAETFSPSSSTELKDLEPYTEYRLTVKAYGNAMDSDYSSAIYQKTKEDVPSAPTDVRLITPSESPSDVLVEWRPPRYPHGVITAYHVTYQSLNASHLQPDNSTIITNGTTLQAVFHGLKSGYHYAFTVVAFTSVGKGPRSSRLPYIVRVQESPNKTPFPGLVNDLEKGIVIGIVLATICIMICTLLLLFRHRRDCTCRHKFCVTKQEEKPVSGIELVGDKKPVDSQLYSPLTQSAVLQHQHCNGREDPKCREPLLNDHSLIKPHSGYLIGTTPTITNTTTTTTSKIPPPHHQPQRQESSLPHLASTSHQESLSHQPFSLCPASTSRSSSQQDITETSTHQCLVHPDPASTSALDESHIALLQEQNLPEGSGTDSPPRPASYRGTNSDSGMDGDIDWDLGDDLDDADSTTCQSVDPSTYLSSKMSNHSDHEDTSPDFNSKALYLCSGEVTYA